LDNYVCYPREELIVIVGNNVAVVNFVLCEIRKLKSKWLLDRIMFSAQNRSKKVIRSAFQLKEEIRNKVKRRVHGSLFDDVWAWIVQKESQDGVKFSALKKQMFNKVRGLSYRHEVLFPEDVAEIYAASKTYTTKFRLHR
jgi:hypothetical protein